MDKKLSMEEISKALESIRPNKEVYHAPLEVGKYEVKITACGIEEKPNEILESIGFYQKPAASSTEKRTDYIKLHIETTTGKKASRNIWKENESIIATNIRRQLHIEDDMTLDQLLAYVMMNEITLNMWVSYNDGFKNFDFYDAEGARADKARRASAVTTFRIVE